MFSLDLLLTLAACSAAPLPQTAPQAEPTPQHVRQAVARSLPYLEEEGLSWMQTRKCNSCHRVTFLAWSHHEASVRGVAVDRKKLDEWTRWVLDDTFKPAYAFRLRDRAFADLRGDGLPEAFLAKVKKTKPTVDQTLPTKEAFAAAWKKVLTPEEFAQHSAALTRRAALPNNGGGPDTLSQVLLSSSPEALSPELAKKYEAARELLLEWQELDGSWLGGGQLPGQRRPRSELNETTTMWAVLALSSGKGSAESSSARAKALKWLQGGKPGVSTESLLLRMAVEHRFGDPGRARALLAQLEREQRPDGGWSWARGGSVSEAFTTGQVLYALGVAGKDGHDPVVRRAWKHLLASQQEDGSWSVPAAGITTRTGKSLEKVAEVYRYWGTAWAVIGLSRTLPAAP